MRLGGSPRRVQSLEGGAGGLISQRTRMHTHTHHVSINDMLSVKTKQANKLRKESGIVLHFL